MRFCFFEMDKSTRNGLMIFLAVLLLLLFLFHVVIDGGIVHQAARSDKSTGFSKFLSPFVKEEGVSSFTDVDRIAREKKWSFYTFNIAILAVIIISIVLGVTTPSDVKYVQSLVAKSKAGDADAQESIKQLAGIVC